MHKTKPPMEPPPGLGLESLVRETRVSAVFEASVGEPGPSEAGRLLCEVVTRISEPGEEEEASLLRQLGVGGYYFGNRSGNNLDDSYEGGGGGGGEHNGIGWRDYSPEAEPDADLARLLRAHSHGLIGPGGVPLIASSSDSTSDTASDSSSDSLLPDDAAIDSSSVVEGYTAVAAGDRQDDHSASDSGKCVCV